MEAWKKSISQIAMRLRAVGRLADAAEAGTSLRFVVSMAKAMVNSCDNLLDLEDPAVSERKRVPAP